MRDNLKFCREIDVLDSIFYDPVENLFLINGETALEVNPIAEYKILDAVEKAEIAGLSQAEILFIVSGIIWNSYPKLKGV